MTCEELMQAASDPTAGTGASGDGAEGTARVEGLLARIEDCEDDAPDRGDQPDRHCCELSADGNTRVQARRDPCCTGGTGGG